MAAVSTVALQEVPPAEPEATTDATGAAAGLAARRTTNVTELASRFVAATMVAVPERVTPAAGEVTVDVNAGAAGAFVTLETVTVTVAESRSTPFFTARATTAYVPFVAATVFQLAPKRCRCPSPG